VPDLAATVALDRIAQAANAGQVADIPVGVGFCLFLRRDCLDQVGLFREDVFGPGYGEENDWCLRAAQAGWRHVAALDVFVGHVGGRSFGAERAALRRRNAATLERLHPGYDARIAAHAAADPLFEARRRMDTLRWAEGRQGAAVLLVTHAEGGGVAEMVAARAAAVRRAGQRPVVLRPAKGGCAIEGFPNLRYAVPAELPALAALLGPDRATHIEVHHLLGHRHAVLGLATLLGVKVDTWVHDAAAFCPRINLVGRSGRYCGEPDVAACEECVAALGSHLRERIGVRGLLARSTAELAASRRVVVATQDGARRLRRHFPEISPEIEAWEDDAALPALARPGTGPIRIVIVGAIAVEKGYDVLLECVRDARSRACPLEFVVCGFTSDDERLMAAGNAFVTGRYQPAEAVALIRAQAADLAFVPSVCPESWCYGLSRAWQAGLEAVAFDLGAQAERIRATGRGAVLPLALPIAAVNDALLRLARLRRARQCPQP
jgi:glycosyltransferase involved in cell wall biosynthesis